MELHILCRNARWMLWIVSVCVCVCVETAQILLQGHCCGSVDGQTEVPTETSFGTDDPRRPTSCHKVERWSAASKSRLAADARSDEATMPFQQFQQSYGAVADEQRPGGSKSHSVFQVKRFAK